MNLPLKEQIRERNKLIIENRPKNIKYFDIAEYINLKLFSTYIFISPRNIGKTYSTYKFVINVYETCGEYTIWMRTNGDEIKQTIENIKSTHPDWMGDRYVLEQDKIIDKETGNLVIHFIAYSKIHLQASTNNENCFGIVYDEFISRSGRIKLKYKNITDFIKTVERKNLTTVILLGNAVNGNNEILLKFDLWIDSDVKIDLENRLYYKRITEWETLPDTGNISTANIWMRKDAELEQFFNNSTFLVNDLGSIIPLNKTTIRNWYALYRLNGKYVSVGETNDGVMLVADGKHFEAVPQNLTPTDAFNNNGDSINIVDGLLQLQYLIQPLQLGQVKFTSFELRDEFYKFILNYIPRKL